MKKTYINPNIEVIKIATQQMLAGSTPGFSKTGETSTMEGHDDDFDW